MIVTTNIPSLEQIPQEIHPKLDILTADFYLKAWLPRVVIWKSVFFLWVKNWKKCIFYMANFWKKCIFAALKNWKKCKNDA